MNKELRHGKYTEEEYAQLIMSRLLFSEREIIIKGLDFLELQLQDILFSKEQSVVKKKNKKAEPPSTTNNSFLERIDKKAAEIENKDQALVLFNFMNTLPNVVDECKKLSLEENEAKEVVSGYKLFIDGLPAFRRRYGKQIKTDTEDIIKKFTDEYESLITNNISLKWIGEQATLFKISNNLFENETTNNKNAFANAINTGEVCSINSKRMEFFVMLFYKLVEKPSPKIVTDKTSGNGAIGAASRFFCHNGKTHNRNMSMPDLMKRINTRLLKNDENLKKTKDEVEVFLMKF